MTNLNKILKQEKVKNSCKHKKEVMRVELSTEKVCFICIHCGNVRYSKL